jgi:2-methylcitrate dehydratase PrpD
VLVTLRDGRQLELERRDYPGFTTNPMPWSDVREKFMQLAAPHTSSTDLTELVSAVENLEGIRVRELTRILSRISAPAQSSTIAAA